ncbi:hypothetical protein HYPSUDRAFT_61894 [Hypholoma sublateritium FD-334 SS-4]|uniref:G-patch domain-containing protein n=1 Tax=Hypholoma sublateritium (strain FD-334 SS-4) TaxID=945553 RepID=A0A0D2LM57_HYPSF|nr:hypothetical protein HYPSUDRAFT_61894 [Hypholoma sublateritium FD-334 SS-4]
MSNVSFTIRRPTPVSRAASATPAADAAAFKTPAIPSPLARSTPPTTAANDDDDDSSGAESPAADELVTGFDRFGVQRSAGPKRPASTPLVIAPLRNKDWRALARRRRGQPAYVPPSAAAATGADGSVGGLGTRDAINAGPVLSGLQVRAPRPASAPSSPRSPAPAADADVPMPSEDEAALLAVLAEAAGEPAPHTGPALAIAPVSETDALRQDVADLPDAATPADYARVPVAQFGAALLRGMGWKEGTAATRKPGRGLVEPYLPAARPALLGIGAKEQEVYDDGSKKRKGAGRPERRYVPIVKQERAPSGTASPAGRRSRSRSPRRSAASSRRASPYARERESNGGSARRGDDMDRRRTEDRERRRYDDQRDTRRRDDDRERRRDDERPASRRESSSYDRRRDR